jgi:hypothetical protein
MAEREDTIMTGHADTAPEAAVKTALDAYTTAGAAVLSIAQQAGVPIMIRPVWPGASSEMTTAAEPSAGIRIAVTLRKAAERVTRDYIRWAREAGLSWHETAAALDLGAGAKERGQALSEAAFEYATGGGTGDWDWPPSFAWTCQACGQHITDRGPYKGHPEDRESGHAGGCERLAAEITAYHEWASQ